MRLLHIVLSPLPVLEHHHVKPRAVYLLDAVMVSTMLSTMGKLRYAVRPPVEATVAARAAYLRLQREGVPPTTAEIAATLAATEWVLEGGVETPVHTVVYERAKRLLAEGDELELRAENIVVSPLTLDEFLHSPVALRELIPPETVVYMKTDGTAVRLEEVNVAELKRAARLSCEELERAAALLAAGLEEEGVEAARAAAEAVRAAAAQAKSLVRAVENVLATRVSVEDEGERGVKTQGWSGHATGYFEYFDVADAFADPFLDAVKRVMEKLEGAARLKLLTRIWRRDKRVTWTWVPGVTPVRTAQPLLVAGIDASGSINDREARLFVKAVSALADKGVVDPRESLVVWWSTRIETIRPLMEVAEDARRGDLKIPSGGGTDPAVFFDWLKAEAERGRLRGRRFLVALLTDGVFEVDEALAKGLEWAARKAVGAVALVTENRETGEALRRLGWEVVYVDAGG